MSSLWEFFAGLLSHHVLGVAVRPVRICLADGLFAIAESGGCTTKRACQVAYGTEGSRARFDAPGEPARDLLQLPAVAVGITEYGARAVGETLGMQALGPGLPGRRGRTR